jgi:hypothetical protein
LKRAMSELTEPEPPQGVEKTRGRRQGSDEREGWLRGGIRRAA